MFLAYHADRNARSTLQHPVEYIHGVALLRRISSNAGVLSNHTHVHAKARLFSVWENVSVSVCFTSQTQLSALHLAY